MRKKLEIVMSFIAAELIAIFFELYVLKETELLRLVFGTFLVALLLFVVFLLLFAVSYTREQRKNKKTRKNIDQLSLE